MAYACDTMSFCYSRSLKTSPYTLLHKRPVPFAFLQPFWTPCFVYLGHNHLDGKVGHSRAYKSRMVGYSYTSLLGRVYKVIEIVGTSSESWEKAAAAAVKRASKSLRELRVAEVVAFDATIKAGKIESYRTKLKVSFKFES